MMGMSHCHTPPNQRWRVHVTAPLFVVQAAEKRGRPYSKGWLLISMLIQKASSNAIIAVAPPYFLFTLKSKCHRFLTLFSIQLHKLEEINL